MKKLITLVTMLVSLQVFCMQIFVKLPNELTIALEVEANDTIENVKSKVQDRSGYATDKFDLYFGELLLQEGRTLADYNIQKEANLNLVVASTLSTIDVFSDKNVYFDISRKALVFKSQLNILGSIFIYDYSGNLLEKIKLNQKQSEYPIISKGALIVNIVTENKKTKNIKIINR